MNTFKLAVIGGSLGAVPALREIMAGLGADLSLPLAIVLHREPGDSVAPAGLFSAAGHSLAEAGDKMEIKPGGIYLAPADYHLLADKGRFCLSLEEPVNGARPSIDVLFESAAAAYGPHLLAILLSGNSPDGSAGLLKIKEAGGLTVVQAPATAQAPAMPAAALALGAAELTLPPSRIAELLAGKRRIPYGKH